MIAILKKDGVYSPVILCDECGQPIADAFNALALSSSAPEGKTAEVHHVHKGPCDDAASARLGGMHGSEELSVHLVQLLKNSLSESELERVENLMRWTKAEG